MAPGDRHDNKEGFQALHQNAILNRYEGNSVLNTGTVSTGNNDIEVDISGYDAVVDGTKYTNVSGTAQLSDGDPDYNRKDIIYIDDSGNVAKKEGNPEEVAPAGTDNFNTHRPMPPDMKNIDGAIVAVVWVPEEATSNSDISIRKREYPATPVFGDTKFVGNVSLNQAIDLGDDVKLEFGAAPDFSLRYDSNADELKLKDEVNDTEKQAWDKSGDSYFRNGDVHFGDNSIDSIDTIELTDRDSDGNNFQFQENQSSGSLVISHGGDEIQEMESNGDTTFKGNLKTKSNKVIWANGSEIIEDPGTTNLQINPNGAVNLIGGALKLGGNIQDTNGNVFYEESSATVTADEVVNALTDRPQWNKADETFDITNISKEVTITSNNTNNSVDVLVVQTPFLIAGQVTINVNSDMANKHIYIPPSILQRARNAGEGTEGGPLTLDINGYNVASVYVDGVKGYQCWVKNGKINHPNPFSDEMDGIQATGTDEVTLRNITFVTSNMDRGVVAYQAGPVRLGGVDFGTDLMKNAAGVKHGGHIKERKDNATPTQGSVTGDIYFINEGVIQFRGTKSTLSSSGGGSIITGDSGYAVDEDEGKWYNLDRTASDLAVEGKLETDGGNIEAKNNSSVELRLQETSSGGSDTKLWKGTGNELQVRTFSDTKMFGFSETNLNLYNADNIARQASNGGIDINLYGDGSNTGEYIRLRTQDGGGSIQTGFRAENGANIGRVSVGSGGIVLEDSITTLQNNGPVELKLIDNSVGGSNDKIWKGGGNEIQMRAANDDKYIGFNYNGAVLYRGEGLTKDLTDGQVENMVVGYRNGDGSNTGISLKFQTFDSNGNVTDRLRISNAKDQATMTLNNTDTVLGGDLDVSGNQIFNTDSSDFILRQDTANRITLFNDSSSGVIRFLNKDSGGSNTERMVLGNGSDTVTMNIKNTNVDMGLNNIKEISTAIIGSPGTVNANGIHVAKDNDHVVLEDTNANADEGKTVVKNDNGFRVIASDDAYTTFNAALEVKRTSATVDEIDLGGNLDLNQNEIIGTNEIRSDYNSNNKFQMFGGQINIRVDNNSGSSIKALEAFTGGNVQLPNGTLTVKDSATFEGDTTVSGANMEISNSGQVELLFSETGTNGNNTKLVKGSTDELEVQRANGDKFVGIEPNILSFYSANQIAKDMITGQADDFDIAIFSDGSNAGNDLRLRTQDGGGSIQTRMVFENDVSSPASIRVTGMAQIDHSNTDLILNGSLSAGIEFGVGGPQIRGSGGPKKNINLKNDSGNTVISIDNAEQVGIGNGNTSPSHTLDVDGSLGMNNSDIDNPNRIIKDAVDGDFDIFFGGDGTNTGSEFRVRTQDSNGSISTRFTVTNGVDTATVNVQNADLSMNSNKVNNVDFFQDQTIKSSAPSSPSAGDWYIDDGTNTSSGNLAIRIYNGTSWVDQN